MRAAEEKLGRETTILDVRGLVDAYDALVVTSGRSDRQVRAIVDEIDRLVTRDVELRVIHREGYVEGEWVALDYGDVIVHVFIEEAREFYDLEHLWRSASRHEARAVPRP